MKDYPQNGHFVSTASAQISRAQFEEIADRHGLTIPDGEHRRGPNPFTNKGEDGFCFFWPECNGSDRGGSFKKSRREMLELFGVSVLAPEVTPSLQVRNKTFDIRSLEERGLTPEARRHFNISEALGLDSTWGEYRQFPTYHPDGREARHRRKFRDPSRQPAVDKDGKPRRQAKNFWDSKTKDKGQPIGYGLNWIQKSECIYLVNSELAVWLFWQHGLRAICPLGEGRSEASFRTIFDCARTNGAARIVVLLDADATGKSATATALKAARAVGLKAAAKQFPESVKSGYDASDFEEAHRNNDLSAALDTLLDVQDEPAIAPYKEPFRPKISTARELIAKEIPPAKWIANGLISEGLTIFAGNPKLGKSWAMLGLGLAVAFGGAWLGNIHVEAGHVLYLALEDNERRMKARLQKCLNGQPAPENFHYATEWRRVDEGGAVDLEEWLKAHPDARLIVVDTLQKVKPRRRNAGNVYEQDSDDVGALKVIADRYAVAIVCVHHRRKGHDADDLEAVSGSYGLTGAADGVLTLKRERGKSDAILTATGRDLEEEKELALKFDSTLGSWIILGEAEEYRMSNERAAIVNAVREAGQPLSPKEIADATGKNSGAVRFLLLKMVQDNQIEGIGGGRYVLPIVTNIANTTNTTNDTNTFASDLSDSHAQYEPLDNDLGIKICLEGVSEGVSNAHLTANSNSVSGVSDVSSVSGVSGVSGKYSLFKTKFEEEADEV